MCDFNKFTLVSQCMHVGSVVGYTCMYTAANSLGLEARDTHAEDYGTLTWNSRWRYACKAKIHYSGKNSTSAVADRPSERN